MTRGERREVIPISVETVPEATLYFNARCSKCRTAERILADAGIDATVVRYLDTSPSVADLRHLMSVLGVDDPRAMVRTGESVYAELGLAAVGPEQLLEAVSAHPILLERPIFVRNGRAVIAQPPERVHELL